MPKKKSTKVKPEVVIKAITQYNGIRTKIAEALGISRTTLHKYAKDNDRIAQAFEDADNTILDAVESQLMFFTQGYIPSKGNQPRQGVPLALQLDAIKFFLRTKGKQRGYSERIEADVTANTPIEVKLVVDEVDVDA